MNEKNLTQRLVNVKQAGETDKSSLSPEDKRRLLLKRVDREPDAEIADYGSLKQAVVFREHLESLLEKEHIKIEEIDKHFLKGFLSYTGRLYATGEISEPTYLSLVTQAAESYAERLVESKITKALEKYAPYLEKLSLRWPL